MVVSRNTISPSLSVRPDRLRSEPCPHKTIREGHPPSLIMPPIRSPKLKERQKLADEIQKLGIEMSPCSLCSKHDRKCIISDDGSRCSECTRRGKKCDAKGPSLADWEALDREENRLRREREETSTLLMESVAKTSALLMESVTKVQEAAAKLQRLEKTQRLWKTRAKEMLRRGLKTMDELDAAEEAERASVPAPVNPSGSPLGPPDDLFSLEAYEHLFDSSGGMLLGASGS